MNKKGFTLVEVLAVMVIVITLSLVIIPNVINRFSNKKDDIKNVNDQLVISAAKLYVSDNKEELNDYTTYCIDINSLIEKKYLSEKNDAFNNEDYADTHKVKVRIGKTFGYDVVESSQCKNSGIYATGNKIKVNDIEFYIISSHDDYVVALKAEPLTYDELNESKIGKDGINHVNRCVSGYEGEVYSGYGGYGWIAYYSDYGCSNINELRYSSCIQNYEESDIRYVVDKYADIKFINGELKVINGFKARLISSDDLVNDLKCLQFSCTNTGYDWIPFVLGSNIDSQYWMMDDTVNQWGARNFQSDSSYNTSYTEMYQLSLVRPVINVYKSAIQQIEGQ